MDRNNGATIARALLALVLLAVVAASLPVVSPPSNASPEESDRVEQSSDGADPEEPVDVRGLLSFVKIAFLGLLGFAGAIAAVLGYGTLIRPSSSQDASNGAPAPEGTTEPDTSLDEVASAAGRAAERIRRSESFENEVYRAWWEMTRALAVSRPRTKTAGEFATAAIRAGMDESDVRELTRLFDDVRYGNVEPDSDDERRAIDVLERIEASYRSDRS